jgi:hypothetical protein
MNLEKMFYAQKSRTTARVSKPGPCRASGSVSLPRGSTALPTLTSLNGWLHHPLGGRKGLPWDTHDFHSKS